ncbi:MAG: GIY-YIG nuclease family protein [Proteobacteria bacterium]|nr:GIY-YIG nuclease family protein [Pseudomonadota bacterium]
MPDAAAELPGEPGAYVLLIRLDSELTLDMPSFRGKSLMPGLYAYCGSAYGPGGIRARVSRHLRGGKPLRWHVDRLTAAGRVEQVGILVAGRECDLATELLATGGLQALPGFGSSDCRTCAGHLLHLPKVETLPTDIFDLVVSGGREVH